MSAPRWAREILRRSSDPAWVDELLGDLDEAHAARVRKYGRVIAPLFTAFETIDVALAVRREGRRLKTRSSLSPASNRNRLPRISGLDFKLGLRMLVRYPGLSIVGSLAMALGITIGTVVFQVFSDLVFPDHPYSDMGRIVGVRNIDTRTTRGVPRAMSDFARWRTELRTVDLMGVQSDWKTNLDIGDGRPVPVAAVVISANAFLLAPGAPYLGRPILIEDENPSSPEVALLSFELWQLSFGADPDIVGRVVHVGGLASTIIGVMPPRFALHVPANDMIYPGAQDLWVPFRGNPDAYAFGSGPRITVFGQLVEGATPIMAETELTNLGAVTAAVSPDTHRYLRPEVRTFTHPFGLSHTMSTKSALSFAGLFIVSVMLLLCANVALLLFARAASREVELVVRSALGASRGRIVMQLFVEALALAGIALVLGWMGASLGLSWIVHGLGVIGQVAGVTQPWVGDTIRPSTMAYAGLLALSGAVMAGVFPGLKATGKRGTARLQGFGGRGAVAPLGRLWSGIIVVQVALTALFIPVAFDVGAGGWKIRSADLGLPPAEYLTARLEMEGDTETGPDRTDFQAQYADQSRELVRRLEAEPGVVAVTLANVLPGGEHPQRLVELEGATDDSLAIGPKAQVASVDANFFDVMGSGLIAGRGFGSADLSDAVPGVIVNESFVREVAGGGSVVGRRMRFPDRPSGGGGSEILSPAPWLEILGVVEDLTMSVDPSLKHGAGIYQLRPPTEYPARIAIWVPGGPSEFVPRLREVGLQVSPTLRLHQPLSMERAVGFVGALYDFFFRILFVISGFALLLTLAGIHAVIAFSVSRRTREIGVRVALGADRKEVISAVLSAMGRRVSIGVLIGGILGWLIAFQLTWISTPQGWAAATGYVLLMTVGCMLPCIAPTLRALGIQPAEALAAER